MSQTAPATKREPWSDAIQFVGAEHDHGHDRRRRPVGDHARSFLDRPAAQRRIEAVRYAPLRKDSDDPTPPHPIDRGANRAHRNALPVDGERIECVEQQRDNTIFVKFDP